MRSRIKVVTLGVGTLLAVVLLAAVVSSAGAQRVLLAAGAEVFLGGGEGLSGTCLEGSTRGGLVTRVGYEVTNEMGLEGTAHVHAWQGQPTCLDGFAPQAGTFLDRDRRNLLTHTFVATDLRARFRTAGFPVAPIVSLGGGITWRSAADLPYGVLGVDLPVPVGAIRAVLHADVHVVRVRFDLVERTWQDFTLVSAIPRGSEHEWKPTTTVALLIEAPISW